MSDLTATEPPPAKGSTKRIALLAGVAVLAVGAVGGGVWGYNAFYGQSEQAASALPVDGLLGYVGFDLAPNGEQLLAARTTLKKFPGIADQIELGGDGDLRKELFTKLQEDGTCTDIDWDKQVAPWLGDRIGIGVMDGGSGKEPEALLVLQTTDESAAEKNVDATLECLNDGSPKDSRLESHAFVGEWLVLGEGDLAKGLAKKIDDKGSLADNKGFQTWTDAAGDAGVLSGFMSPLGYDRLVDALLADADVEVPDALADELDEERARFKGVGFVGRFRDGGVEIEAASSAKGLKVASGAGDALASLPSSTVAALGFGLVDGWADKAIDLYGPIIEDEAGMTVEEAEKEFTSLTGLRLDDLEDLLGEAVVIVVDSDIDGAAIERFDPTALPIGIKIKGDVDEIEAAIEKIRDAGSQMGMPAGFIVSESSGGYVSVSINAKYADKLSEESGLGKATSFTALVPESEQALSAFFLDFDSHDWLDDLLVDFDAPQEVRDNVEPLSGIGMSTWKDGDVAHVLFKLATD